MDFSGPFETYVVSEPANLQTVFPALDNCPRDRLSFTNMGKVLKLKAKVDGEWMKTTFGGMNEYGLSVGVLHFRELAGYTDPRELYGRDCEKAIPHTRLAEYVLARYDTVEAIQADIDSDRFPKVYEERDFPDTVHPMHYSFHDLTGDSVVLEYTKDGGRKTFENTIGAVTNSPTFDWHMMNLRSYPQFQNEDRSYVKWKDASGDKHRVPTVSSGSGLMGMPGDFTSQSRFIKASTLVRLSPRPKTSNEGIIHMFHLLNAADIPKGILNAEVSKESDDSDESNEEIDNFQNDCTFWIVIKDLKRGCMYYRGYTDMSIKRICMEETANKAMMIKIGARFRDSFKDRTSAMEQYDA